MIKPIYEFLLWDNCNNNCKFCFQRKSPRIFNLQQQEIILHNVIDFLDSSSYINGSHVLLVGGEIFDHIERKDILSNFFNIICEYIYSSKIDFLYLNTNLIYNHECYQMLADILKIFHDKNCLQKIKFTTSYDLNGRFKTINDKQLFLTNLKQIKTEISNINIVTNLILTKQMCDSILDNSFKPFDFMYEYKCGLNFIPYIILDKSLVASRQIIFKTLLNLNSINPQFMHNWANDVDLKQPRKMFFYKNDIFNSCECGLSECGHSENFKLYSDKNTCFACDIKKLFLTV